MLRTLETSVCSSSVSEMLASDQPAAAMPPRASSRQPMGVSSGAIRLATQWTGAFTAAAASTASPAAMPWCMVARGINDGP